MKKIGFNFCSLILLIILVSCVNIPRKGVSGKFEAIKLGDSVYTVESNFGKAEENVEVYPGIQFNVFTYYKATGSPDIFFTIDPSTRQVVGKSKWIYPNDPSYDLKTLLSTQFKGVDFETYVPCRTRSDQDRILINRDLGFYIATEKVHAVLLSQATPRIINLRVDLLLKNCPKLQPQGTVAK